jgi:hypothetical protein
MKRFIPIAFLLFAVSVFGASGPPMFSAILTIGSDRQFVLTDAEGRASPYLRIGGTFNGFTLKAYDSKEGALELERDGHTLRISLVADARINAKSQDERHIVENLVAKLPALGLFTDESGKQFLAMGRRAHLQIGDKITVHYQDAERELQLVALDKTTFTVRYNDEEYRSAFVQPKADRPTSTVP